MFFQIKYITICYCYFQSMSVPLDYIELLKSALNAASNPLEAQSMSKYMRNQFPFFGVRAPQCKIVLKNHIKAHGLPQHWTDLTQIVKQAWNASERELQYVAMTILEKTDSLWKVEEMEDIFAFIITNKSWWDTVDLIASNLVHQWWKKDPDLVDMHVIPKWRDSPNFWLNRTSIIYQLKRKKQTKTRILEENILQHSKSEEFFIQKSIGWALREYAKTDTEWVKAFVAKNELKPLSKREALKHINKLKK